MTGTKLRSWITVSEGSDFPIQNIPFGIAGFNDGRKHAVTRIGDDVIDLYALYGLGYFSGIAGLKGETLQRPFLNDFIALGKKVTNAVRERIAALFEAGNPELREHSSHRLSCIPDRASFALMLPVRVGDYTDFYSSIEHATNLGKMFRDPANALLPNWRHLPVGYHGRASSIVVSGTPLHRPKGQTKPDEDSGPVFGPTKMLDFELEVAFVTCKPTELGQSITTAEAENHIFGFVLFNDMSARDVQKWEYVPLGPFLSKNFGSVISPWIVTLEALEPFRMSGPPQVPEPMPYLQFTGKRNFGIRLEVDICPEGSAATTVCRTNFGGMYWNVCQQLAHQTVNGCNINTGDMYASGTISGPDPGTYGSMLELTWQGTQPLKMADGSERRFLEDGDTVIIRGYGENGGLRIGFGECTTKILPAK
jgi:fumarylacetoacetase